MLAFKSKTRYNFRMVILWFYDFNEKEKNIAKSKEYTSIEFLLISFVSSYKYNPKWRLRITKLIQEIKIKVSNINKKIIIVRTYMRPYVTFNDLLITFLISNIYIPLKLALIESFIKVYL